MTQSITQEPQESRLSALAEKKVGIFSFDEAKNMLQTSNQSARHVLMDLRRKADCNESKVSTSSRKGR